MNIMRFIGDVLDRLHRTGFPEAIVAGGAIRDWDNGMESQIKDIDVFIQDRPMYLFDLNRAFEGWSQRVMVPEHVAHYMDFEGVKVVQEYASGAFVDLANGGMMSAPPVQIVVMGRKVEPMPTIERHDFGICQIGYDGKTFFTTDAYDHDKMNHTFTLVRCRDERDRLRSLKRFERLGQKYTNWSFVDPKGA